MHIDVENGTLLGVTVGATLATVGGLLAGQIENRLRRRERERAAALLFGEILAALKLTVKLADEARGRGEPYGPVTLQIVRAAQRETQIYDRNRESLFDVRDSELRAQTHLVVLQIGLTLDAFLETVALLRSIPKDDQIARANVTGRATTADLDGSFAFMLELRAEIPPLIARFEKIAGQTFDAHERAIAGITGPRRGATDPFRSP